MKMRTSLLLAAALALVAAANAQEGPTAASAIPTRPAMTEIARFKAEEARQGVAVDETYFYAIVNSAIGKYDRKSGARVAQWRDPDRLIAHLNSCAIFESELVCANSNFPQTPMASSVEVFDPATMTHKRSIPLGPALGSLTWLVRREDAWWAMFAHYDERGGEPGKTHQSTVFTQLDDDFRVRRAWMLPQTTLAAMKPTSSSGGVWGDDGLLYVSGHSAYELYVLALPDRGTTLRHIATIPAPFQGQAIARDPKDANVLWGIVRKTGEVVAARLPAP